MSNFVGSQCSTGVESGWTLYLDDDDCNASSVSLGRARRIPESYGLGRSWKEVDGNDDDEDLSMVSDASSGPPCYEVENWRCHGVSGHNGKEKNKRQQVRGRHSHYEDTACSYQNFSISDSHAPRRHGLDFQPGFSNTSLEDKPENKNQCYGYYRSPGAKEAAPRKSSGNSRKLM